MADSIPATVDNAIRNPCDRILIGVTSYVFHYETFSGKAFEGAKLALLDALGRVFETLKAGPEEKSIIGHFVPNLEVPNGFKLPGTSFRLDPVKGAYDLGTLIRYLDHNYAFPSAEWGHPSVSVPIHPSTEIY